MEKLLYRKSEIELQTKSYEDKLESDFKYIRDHAGGMIVSGVKSLILPDKNKKSGHNILGSAFDSKNIWGLVTGLAIPTALSLAQPMILSWGLGKIPTWIINFIIKRLKKR